MSKNKLSILPYDQRTGASLLPNDQYIFTVQKLRLSALELVLCQIVTTKKKEILISK